jgi:hypothetical protein
METSPLISILIPGKDLSLPSSYRPVSLLDTIGKLFENIPLSRILIEVCARGLLRYEQFGFGPKHNSTLHLARLVERVTRNFAKRDRSDFSRRGKNLRYRSSRSSPSQANRPKFPLLPC